MRVARDGGLGVGGGGGLIGLEVGGLLGEVLGLNDGGEVLGEVLGLNDAVGDELVEGLNDGLEVGASLGAQKSGLVDGVWLLQIVCLIQAHFEIEC